MRYTIKERVFTFTDRFNIDTSKGITEYRVVGKFFTLGKKLKMYDKSGREVAYVKKTLFKFLPEYKIYQEGRRVGRIKKKLTLMKPSFKIDSSYGSFILDGNIAHHNFIISKGREVVAWISKRWISVADTYNVEIVDQVDHPFILSLVIILDQIFYDGNKTRAYNDPE